MLQDIEVIHKDSPLPLNKNLREDPEKIRTVSDSEKKDTVDIDRELEKIKKRLMRKYHIVFKDELDKSNKT